MPARASPSGFAVPYHFSISINITANKIPKNLAWTNLELQIKSYYYYFQQKPFIVLLPCSYSLN